ncbi:hypothetical protein [uncultured Massilia sp.]|uniref:hypothetical protein n=1 Tax=uncultured Massilia sp. TaxID=169973 RepID=UPI0025EFC613|nr:hypothetical protein [uncultured Massilia sp.]
MRTLSTVLLAAALLAGCASAPTPGTLVPADRFGQVVVPGKTTRAELVAAFGQTRTVVFDSGMEAWLYSTATPAGAAEQVVLLDRAGIVRKVRTRPPYPGDQPRR